MSCSHKFHLQCTVSWFKTNSAHTCPLCRKEAEPLERLPLDAEAEAKEAEAEEDATPNMYAWRTSWDDRIQGIVQGRPVMSEGTGTATITRQELDNLLYSLGTEGIPFTTWTPDSSSHAHFHEYLDHYFHPQGEHPFSRAWLDATMTISLRELNLICAASGALGELFDSRTWGQICNATTNPYSNDGSGGWIRIHSNTMDRLLKIQGGHGVGHAFSMKYCRVVFDRYDALAISRERFDSLIHCQRSGVYGRSNEFTDEQWEVLRQTFRNDLSQPTGQMEEVDWAAFVAMRQTEPIIVMNRSELGEYLKSSGSQKTVAEFFDEDEWMEPKVELCGTRWYVNEAFIDAGQRPMTEEEFDAFRIRKTMEMIA